MTVSERAAAAARAAKETARLDDHVRRTALDAVAAGLKDRRDEIVRANRNDLERAEREGVAAPLVKRLKFDEKKIEQAITGIRSVVELPDLVGRTRLTREVADGLILRQKSAPIGVIAMVFESRPDALVQIASLAVKSGNGLILKGGSEARESNRILASVIEEATVASGLPEGWIQLLETREDIALLLEQDATVDLMIPRGSNEFVRYIMDNTRIPVLGHADGICHVFLDGTAETEMSKRVVVDSKTQYVAVCNAAETLLVHRESAERLLPAVAAALQERGVELRGCERSRSIVPSMVRATEDDWTAEYLDLVMSVRIVDSVGEAIEHINTYGSGHTDAIVTADEDVADEFMRSVDSASVIWNASTRFADGFRYGLGAEVGISTAKIHARGPVGVEGLLSFKWHLVGKGHIVDEFEGSGATQRYTHRDL